MVTTGIETVQSTLDDFVKAFEEAYVREGGADIAAFLPDCGHPLYRVALRELIFVDLEFRRERGGPTDLSEYRKAFPALDADPDLLDELVHEESRLCRQAEAAVAESRRALVVSLREAVGQGGDPGARNGPDPSASTGPASDLGTRFGRVLIEDAGCQQGGLREAASSYREFRRSHLVGDRVGLDAWHASRQANGDHAELFRDLHVSNPAAAHRLARGMTSLPQVGDKFLGFDLIDELGRGAFGRVFLARQASLANRLVAFKVSAEHPGESQTLAQLQHTNIVPIFSVHHAPPFQAVCMPYFGAVTLRDVFDDLVSRGLVPESGQALLKTLSSRPGKEQPDAESGPAEATMVAQSSTPRASEEPPSASIRPTAQHETLRMLGTLTYVEAILWIGCRLAEGLDHAHGRGILHRDLKPANVLLTEDGQPMLLDFNLAQDSQQTASFAKIGGTLPYMAPEHLAALAGVDRVVDARSDLYSLGVILYELLAGRHPFAVFPGRSMATLTKMIEDRRGGPPALRPFNHQVSPAVESIVRRLLAPDPARRYQSASEVSEDLNRHLANQPLKHAPEPSLRERARKWVRRHPRLTSSTSVGVLAACLIVAFAAFFVMQQRSHARLEAAATLADFRDEFGLVRYHLNTRIIEQSQRAKGGSLARQALARYRVGDDPNWRALPAVTNLRPAESRELRDDVGELLLMLARATAMDAGDSKDSGARKRLVQDALRFCELARTCYAPEQIPHLYWVQRADLAEQLGREDDARHLRQQAEATPLRTARDRCLEANRLAANGEYRQALTLAREAARQDPRDFWAWYVLAHCHDRLEQTADAAACLGTCIALKPADSLPWFGRGMIHERRADHEQAIADFNRAIAIRPEWSEPYFYRGVAELFSGRAREAVVSLTQALDRGAPDTQIYFYRASAHEKLGEVQESRRDREAGLGKKPVDEPSWLARGMARLGTDPNAALADFQSALELNPRYLPALQNSAHVLMELDRNDEALKLLDRAVSLYPDFVPARSGRGVLLAIQGKREAALRDAKETLWRDTSPRILYQVAGIYAMTSRKEPDDRIEAYRLLSTALRGGFGFEELNDDRELDPIRDQPEFRQLLDAARALRGARAAGP